MPLIDIQLAVSGLDSRTLEQAGIIANFFAGFLLASDYLLFNDKINKRNEKNDANQTSPVTMHPFPEINKLKMTDGKILVQVFVLTRFFLIKHKCMLPLSII